MKFDETSVSSLIDFVSFEFLYVIRLILLYYILIQIKALEKR